MARTTIDTVKEILVTSLGDSNITAYINQANRIVTRVLGGEGLSSSLLTDIETWLTAHLITISKERQANDKWVGDARVRYQGSFGEGLQTTTYGQMVLDMDTSGKMQESTMKRASLKAIQQDSDDESVLEDDDW